MKDDNKELRTGFSTGACAAAVSVAAWTVFQGDHAVDFVDLLFPDNKKRKLVIGGSSLDGFVADSWLIKDAGDDVDITDKAVIHAKVSELSESKILDADHLVECGSCRLVIRGGDGVGKVSRKGLDVEVGKWSINPVPRQMIRDNLLEAGIGGDDRTMLFEISVENGEALAKKTLNPVLGVEEGLSILGTTGLVIPCSNAAYISTIKVLLRGAADNGCDTAVLVTGGKTHKLARTELPDIEEIAFVRIGDFIKESLGYCGVYGIKKVIVYCMPGKLVKYAQGHEYTHAHTVAQSMQAFSNLLKTAGCEQEKIDGCKQCRSVREFLSQMEADEVNCILEKLSEMAHLKLDEWSGDCEVELRIRKWTDI